MTQPKIWQRFFSILVLASSLFSLGGGWPAAGRAQAQLPLLPQQQGAALSGPLQPQISPAIKNDLSPALRDLTAVDLFRTDKPRELVPHMQLPKFRALTPQSRFQTDQALQTQTAVGKMPAAGFNFDGVSNVNYVLPPDTNGDIGRDYYVQWVNLSLAIWRLDRTKGTAERIYGPAAGNTLWSGFGGACEYSNDGDPIVLYDHLADRWLASQFALPSYPYGPFYQCIGISQTGDPTGSWYRYAFAWKNGAKKDVMNDYPKFGVWPDGYYLTVNQFSGGIGAWQGAGVASFEREKMLQGQPARMVSFDLYQVNSNFGGLLPSDLDGPPPPPGTPNYFAEVDDERIMGPADAIRLWEFHVDWTNPSNSTFGQAGKPDALLPVTNFTPLCVSISSCIPQPGISQGLDAIGDRLMYRLQYRFFGDYATLVTNHSVDAGNRRAAVRWYELRNAGSGWNIHQQGTYAGDGENLEHRWMGSAAMDNAGNIAVGYSVSSQTVFPSIRYTGRLAGDPLNTLPQGEATLVAGTGSQTSLHARWGDYSMLGLDPSDDCTFWFTSQYYQGNSDRDWRTRVGSFTFPSCLNNGKGYLQGTVIDATSAAPLENARVEAGPFSTVTGANGFYQIYNLPPGIYNVKAIAYGYQTGTAANVHISVGPTSTQDFALKPVPKVTLQGGVTDGSGQGWPLYARIDITAPGYSGMVFTNPTDGTYQVQLAQGSPHELSASAMSAGYQTASRSVTPSPGSSENFVLVVDHEQCIAPGYAIKGNCEPLPGGLVIGNVYDANTGLGINDARVSGSDAAVSGGVDSANSTATPQDPAVEDGFYTLFSSLTGSRVLTATYDLYAADVRSVSVSSGALVEQSFTLSAGRLVADPAAITVSTRSVQNLTQEVALNNVGALPASFSLFEVRAPAMHLQPTGPFAIPTRHVGPKRLADLNAMLFYDYHPPEAELLPGGEVLQSWPAGLAHPWGIGYNPVTNDLWVGNVAAAGGDDALYRFLPSGLATGESISVAAPDTFFAADMTYNPFTRTFWQVQVGGNNCVVEVDPEKQALTGRKICPAFDNSQRGLAFNPLNGSYYSGSWTNGILYHFDASGTILASVDTGLNISGLAFNPASGRLFVLSNAERGYDIYILDAHDGFRLLGGFDVPGLGSFEQGGMEVDCEGHLWVVNQASQVVLEVDSGETAACTWNDIPWLTVSPMGGTLLPGEGQVLTLTLEASAAREGRNSAQIVLTSDTPYGALTIPVVFNLNAFGVSLSVGTGYQAGDAGTAVMHFVQVANTGKAEDTFSLEVSGNRWLVDAPAEIGPLEAWDSIFVTVVVEIPAGAAAGEMDQVEIRVASNGDPTIHTSARLTTIARYRQFFPWIRQWWPPLIFQRP